MSVKLQRYWSDVLKEIGRILGTQLEMDPVSLVLGLPNKNITTATNNICIYMYNMLTFATGKEYIIAVDASPSIQGWL